MQPMRICLRTGEVGIITLLALMRTPRTTTLGLLVLAIILFFFGEILMTGYYPALRPVIGADGSPLIGADGKPVMGRNMAKFYRVNMPSYVCLACSASLFGWWLIRVLKYLYGSHVRGDKES
jgi:hypothetical protein